MNIHKISATWLAGVILKEQAHNPAVQSRAIETAGESCGALYSWYFKQQKT